jgi:basic amino acid/polyamine antiporter, APA family
MRTDTSTNSKITDRTIGLPVAMSIVVANMVGAGVFTSIGFQVAAIPQPIPILALWLAGGVLAICGAFVYGEIGAAFPRSGGEYNYLSRLYSPSVGFLSGWVSATVGFSAPIALAATAFGHYIHGIFPAADPRILATLLIIFLTSIHLIELRIGGRFQGFVTLFEIVLIVIFIICGFSITPAPIVFSLLPKSGDIASIFNPAFAVSLVYVSYAYSGWNGSTYLASEIRNPSRTVPKSILSGTLIVIGLYMLLNFVFLRSTPIPELSGKVEAGLISSVKIFGDVGGRVMGILIALCLVSSVSSMIISGPRILKVMGEDYRALRLFSRENSKGVPWVAILTQSCIALLLLWTGTFETVLTMTGFTLTLFTTLTVAGVFILRSRRGREPGLYKTTGYPVTPLLFLGLNLWMLTFLLVKRPGESFAGLGIVAAGAIVYYFLKGAK